MKLFSLSPFWLSVIAIPPSAAMVAKIDPQVIFAGLGGLVPIVAAGTVSIIISLRKAEKKGRERDEKLDQIHILVNSRLTIALRVIARSAKREAERTGNAEDLEVYAKALKELEEAEDSNVQAVTAEIFGTKTAIDWKSR